MSPTNCVVRSRRVILKVRPYKGNCFQQRNKVSSNDTCFTSSKCLGALFPSHSHLQLHPNGRKDGVIKICYGQGSLSTSICGVRREHVRDMKVV